MHCFWYYCFPNLRQSSSHPMELALSNFIPCHHCTDLVLDKLVVSIHDLYHPIRKVHDLCDIVVSFIIGANIWVALVMQWMCLNLKKSVCHVPGVPLFECSNRGAWANRNKHSIPVLEAWTYFFRFLSINLLLYLIYIFCNL